MKIKNTFTAILILVLFAGTLIGCKKTEKGICFSDYEDYIERVDVGYAFRFYDCTYEPNTLWSFGDGTYSSDKDVYHTYTEPGIYPVRLVSSSANSSSSVEKTMVVKGCAPRFSGDVCEENITYWFEGEFRATEKRNDSVERSFAMNIIRHPVYTSRLMILDFPYKGDTMQGIFTSPNTFYFRTGTCSGLSPDGELIVSYEKPGEQGTFNGIWKKY